MAGQREQDAPGAETATVVASAGVGERLSGKKILLTGATGFLGKAVLATLLRVVDDPRLVLAVRADGPAAAGRRLDEVLDDDALGVSSEQLRRLRAEERVRAVPCNLESDGLGDSGGEPWADVDIAIHCAATVSFEEPLDEAIALNGFGPRRLLEHLREGGSDPHFVHVSTAYVADRRSGVVYEDLVPHEALPGLDVDALLAGARARREELEDESRTQPLSGRFGKAAERDASRRPDLDPAERAEELRQRWLQEKLARDGRRRAMAQGWPDTYALSKALGERLLGEISTSTTVIRPTIIESSLRSPCPGWLEGIKVADPLILAYASRGLTHLPARATNVIDIVPVDLVAHACVAAAAHPPSQPLKAIAIGSSARRPLAIGELAEQTRRYFRRHPLTGRNGSPIEIGDLRFVDQRVAVRKSVRRERLAAMAARIAMSSPVHLPQERLLRSNRALAERVTRMVKIYGAYTELNCVFDDTNACELASSLRPDDRELLPFDTAAIDWDEYLQEIHLPQVRRLAEGG